MKPVAIFDLLGALVMIGLVVRGLQQGQIRFKAWLDVRSKSPIHFWASIVVYSLVAVGCLLVAAKETFFSN
jgi:hypothetical protein